MKRLLFLWLLLTAAPMLAPEQTHVQVTAQPTIRGNMAQFTPSLNLDFTQGVMPAGVTFTRASGATRFNASGQIETVAANTPRFDYDPTTYVGQNLIRYSNDFTNAAWNKINTTVSSSTLVAPTGEIASKLNETSSASGHGLSQGIVTTSINAVSVWVKAGERSWVWLYYAGMSGASVWYDLNTGTVGSAESSNVSGTITAGPNGWYRLTIRKNVAINSSGFQINTTTGNGVTSYAGDGTSGFYIASAQYEVSTNAGIYSPTSATANTATVPATCRGLLVEEARTNFIVNSTNPDVWSKGGNTVKVSGACFSPDGSLAPSFTNTTNVGSNVSHPANVVLSPSTTYTRSLYVKCLYASTPTVKKWVFECSAGTGYAVCSFNLADMSVSFNDAYTVSARIINAGNGWYRLVHTFTSASTGGAAASQNYVGGYGGVPEVCTFAAWGAQVEVGTFPTSLIATVNMAAVRSADDCSKDDVGFSLSQGSLWVEYSRYQNVDFGSVVDVNNIATMGGPSPTTARLTIIAGVTQDPRPQFVASSSASVIIDAGAAYGLLPVNTVVRGYLAYQSGNNAVGRIGSAINTNTGTFTNASNSFRYMVIGGSRNSIFGPPEWCYLNGYIRKIRGWNTRLSNVYLQTLNQ